MRRKRDALTSPEGLLPAELSILAAGVKLMRQGRPQFHGFLVAKETQSLEGGRLLSHGALYRALHRMERAGLLTSSWENPELAEHEARPRRRLYEVTGNGVKLLEDALKQQARGQLKLVPRPVT